MAIIFAKTVAGQQEIGKRAHALPRLARTLLVLVDGHRSDEQLLQMVRGATAQDLELVLAGA